MMTCRNLLLTLSASAISLGSISCNTTETSSTNGQQVVATTGSYEKKGKWGGAVRFVQDGMEIDDEPAAYQMDPKVDYVDYERGIVNFSFGNKETFYPEKKEEKEVKFKKIGF